MRTTTVIRDSNGQPIFEVFASDPGRFPVPSRKGNEVWLLARLAEVWSHHAGELIDEQLKLTVLDEMSRNRCFNSAVIDFQIHEGRPVNVIFHHQLNQPSLMG